MTARLIVLAEDGDAPWHWGLFPGGASSPSATGVGLTTARDALADAGRRGQVTMIVPGAHVSVRRVNLPKGDERQLRAAVPFAVEDDIATDLSSTHFAMAAVDSGDGTLVAIVDNGRMRSWLDACGAAGLDPGIIVPDFLAVPSGAGTRMIHRRNGTSVVVLPDGRGFTTESSLSNQIVPRLKAKDWPEAQSRSMSDQDFIALIATTPVDRLALNLLQGAYGPRQSWAHIVATWRRPALLAACLGGLWMANVAASGWSMARQADDAYLIAEAAARNVLTQDARIVNPRAQLAAAARALRSQADDSFLALSAIAAAAVADVAGASLDTIEYGSGKVGLTFQVSAPSYESVQSIRASIEQRGGLLEDGELRQAGDAVQAQLVVRWP